MSRWAVLQAAHGQLVRAQVEQPAAGLALTDPGAVQEWETFTVHDAGDGKVSLTAANGRVVCAEFGGGTVVLAGRDAVGGGWEKFTRSVNDDGTVSFKADNGKFLRAVAGGGDVILADGEAASGDARFAETAFKEGEVENITLKTKGGHYVAVERGGGGRLVAHRDALHDSQTFAVDDLAGGQVTLRASNDQYVCDDRNRSNRVVADRSVAGEWERFTWRRPDGKATLQASSGRYVCADYLKKGDLYADRLQAGDWERFTEVAGWERPRPKKLLVFYGWPSGINQAPNLDRAAAHYACYEYVVLGRRVEEDAHADRGNTAEIVRRVARLSQGATRIFGYVPLGQAKEDEKLSDGVTPDRAAKQRYDVAQITGRIKAWKALGVSGVLLDEFDDKGKPEFDEQGKLEDVTIDAEDRRRQNAAVDAAHAAGLAVIANGWHPDEIFGERGGLRTALTATDFYLCESWQLNTDEPDGYTKAGDWKAKAELVRQYQQTLQFRVMSVTTTNAATFKAGDLDYAWYSALLYGHEAFGWGEATFSAGDPMKDSAPLRPRPALGAHSFTADGITVGGTRYSRPTDRGTVWVDTASHTAGVQ